MMAQRHILGRDDCYLDAARECILAVGVRRTTLTDVARRAGVSRMTLYRRWPDMQTLLSDLMTREWATMAAETVAAPMAAGERPARWVAASVVATVTTLRANPLLHKILDVDPELLLPYLLHRRGRTHDAILEVLVALIGSGQRAGSVRAGDPVTMARLVLLAAQGFAISVATMADDRTEGTLGEELEVLLERYLRP